MIAFPAWRRTLMVAPRGFVLSPASVLALQRAANQPKEGRLVEFPLRGTHFLDAVIAREQAAKAERLMAPATRKTLLTFALRELLMHNQRQFAVVYETVFQGTSNVEAARRVGLSPAAIAGYKRRGLKNLHTIFTKAEGALLHG